MFDDYWLDYIGCHEAVKNAFRLTAFTHLLSRSHSNIIIWRSTALNLIDFALIETELTITVAENLNIFLPSNHSLLIYFYDKFLALQRQNSIKWAQHSHLIWVCNGDRNTSFFHNSARICKYQSHITQIYDLNRNLCADLDSIQHAFLNYYSNLWYASDTDSLPNIFMRCSLKVFPWKKFITQWWTFL